MYFEEPQVLLNRAHFNTKNTYIANSDSDKTEILRQDLGKNIETQSKNKILYEDGLKKYNRVYMETWNLSLGILICSILSYYYIKKE